MYASFGLVEAGALRGLSRLRICHAVHIGVDGETNGRCKVTDGECERMRRGTKGFNKGREGDMQLPGSKHSRAPRVRDGQGRCKAHGTATRPPRALQASQFIHSHHTSSVLDLNLTSTVNLVSIPLVTLSHRLDTQTNTPDYTTIRASHSSLALHDTFPSRILGRTSSPHLPQPTRCS